MAQNDTRYDKLKDRLKEEFSRTKTLAPAFAADESFTVFNLNDHDSEYLIDPRFQKYGPFNALYVQNFSNRDIRLYLNEDRTAFVDVPAATNQAIPVLQKVPTRYVDYLRAENLDGANSISEGEVLIHVGNEVDSEELTLLEMSGLLNV